MTQVLLTGGTGFIGHNVLLDLLVATDWDIVVVDSNRHKDIPDRILNDPRYDARRVGMFSHNLMEPLKSYQLFPHPNIIINIASNSHVSNSIYEPAEFIKENVAIAVNMLEYARGVKPDLFIQFSTDEVYGAAPDGVNFPEWSPILPSNPYSASKAAQEAIAISYWRTFGVPVVITNTMNVIGPGQHHEKFVPMVVEKLMAGEAVPVHAQFRTENLVLPTDPPQLSGSWEAGSRHYTFVSNISSALQFIAKTTPAQYGVHNVDRPDRYNLVGDREVKNDDMVRFIADIMGVPYKIDYTDFHSSRPGHDRRYALDGAKLKGLGWEAPFTFAEGLKITIESSLRGEDVG